MNVITKLMYSIHRILGTLLCILFLMWFLSAFVMMYHRFPRVSTKERRYSRLHHGVALSVNYIRRKCCKRQKRY